MPAWLRRIFWFINTFFMVPIFRLGLGFFLGNPLSGYIMVLKVRGRKSGRMRYAPVNYAIANGRVYCVSGGRRSSAWYQNIKAHPQVELMLPGGNVFGQVEEVSGEGERLLMIRQVLKNAGLAGFFEGYNPFTIADEELLKKTADLPLLRIQPLGPGSGACDAGGWAWVWALIFTGWLAWLLLR